MNYYRLVLTGIFWIGMMVGLHAGEPITIQLPAKSDHFAVTLPANPTTGFQWKLLSYDKRQFRLLSSKYMPSKPALVGSGGHMQYNFSLLNPKRPVSKTSMTFVYQRPWEKTSVDKQTVWVFSGK